MARHQPLYLPLHGLNDPRVGVAQEGDSVAAAAVYVLLTAGVPNPSALPLHEGQWPLPECVSHECIFILFVDAHSETTVPCLPSIAFVNGFSVKPDVITALPAPPLTASTAAWILVLMPGPISFRKLSTSTADILGITFPSFSTPSTSVR